MTVSPTNLVPTPISSVIGQGAASSAAPVKELDKDAFLKLLITQMRYQDPTSPMDSSQLMAQTSQLASVEKLTALAETSQQAFAVQQRLGAASLIGRQVTWTTADGGTASGSVAAVTLQASGPLLKVGDSDITLDQVTSVVASAAS